MSGAQDQSTISRAKNQDAMQDKRKETYKSPIDTFGDNQARAFRRKLRFLDRIRLSLPRLGDESGLIGMNLSRFGNGSHSEVNGARRCEVKGARRCEVKGARRCEVKAESSRIEELAKVSPEI